MVRKYLCLVISEFKELGFGVVPGKQTMVSIQEQRVTFLPPPWGVCDSGSDKSDYLFYDTYSIPSCRLRMVSNRFGKIIRSKFTDLLTVLNVSWPTSHLVSVNQVENQTKLSNKICF